MCKHALASLRAAGFFEFDLFAPKKVSLSDGEDVIRQRCPEAATESQLFATAIASVGRAFVREIDFVLVIRADMFLWAGARRFMEATIEPNFIAAYFPVTPYPFFLEQNRHLPCQPKLGWWETDVDEPVSGAPCLAFSKHTVAMLAGHLDHVLEPSKANISLSWDYQLSLLVRDLDMPCFSAAMSLGWSQRLSESDMAYRVPPEAKLKEGFESKNFYLG
jgi:hypothetical protein